MELLIQIVVTVIFPPILLFGFYIIPPRQEVVVLRFGKLADIKRSEGINWSHPVGRTLKRITTQDTTMEIPLATVVEKNGSPIQVSAVAVYRIRDSKRAALDVRDPIAFIHDQASAVMKRVCSLFPYETADDNTACLKKESAEVSDGMIAELQKAVEAAGIEVVSFRLNDLTYAPEIAHSMLMRQQAMAMVDARKTIVEGAVQIVDGALASLEAKGHKLDQETRASLVSNLLVVICSGESAQPVLNVSSPK